MKTGDKFNRLEFIEDLGMVEYGNTGKKHRVGKFICDCGNITILVCSSVKYGSTQSCGCYVKEFISSLNKKHGFRHHPLYPVWLNIKTRCNNKNSTKYKDYGGRGISICDEWKNDFVSFHNWAIDNGWERGLQIDRINNDGNYEPSNCQWVTNLENCAVGKRRIRADNSSGFTGIYYTNGKWVAELNSKHLGTFTNIEEAVESRINAEIVCFGEQKTNIHYNNLITISSVGKV